MARIPTILSDPDRNVLPDSGRPAMSTPDMFGAQVGDAQIRGGQQEQAAGMAMGAAITGLGVAAGNYFEADEKKRNESATASGVANYDFTGDFIAMKKTGAKNGETFAQSVSNAYDSKVDKYVEGMLNETVRVRVKNHLMGQKPRFIDAAEAFSNTAAVANDRQQADGGLITQLNATEADPSIDTYNDALQKGLDIINTRPNILDHEKGAMRKKYAEDLALRRFQGLIRGANDDPVALGAIETELTTKGSPWQSVLSDEGFTRVLDKVTSMKRTASSQESTAARAVLQTFADRNAKGEIIDPVELSIGQETIGKAKNSTILSQFAKIQAQQAIFRDHRVMPLDQQRDKIAEYRKTKGVTGLPAPIQAGISEGFALTGGQISTDYLAGMVNFEYGQNIASGDYGKGTGHVGADGKPTSDAVGVAQFTSPTWRNTVRAHAEELGVSAGATDAQIDALRTDKTEAGATRQIKAAALHALDNKKILESSLNRPVNDGDLYFAHFLGAGGAVRFLQAATQNPNALATTSVDAAQVAANKPVFYDEQGRPRTNAQVRGFVTQGTINSVSYVGFAKVQAAEMVLHNTIRDLKDDPVTFAQKTGNFGDVGDMSTVEGVARRGVVIGQMAEFYKMPTSEIKPLSKTEAETFGNKARDGTTEETLGVMMQIQALKNPEAVRAANKQIGEKDSVFGRAAGLAFEQPDQFNVAADIIRGEKRMKTDKDVVAMLGTEQDVQAAFTAVVGKALAGTTHGTEIRKAAMAHYVERQYAKGDAKSVLNKALFEESVQAVLGGGGHPGGKAIENVNGVPTVLPNGLSGGEFNDALKRATPADYMTALSKWGTPPRYQDGAVIKPSEIASQGKFEAIGGGEYRIKMDDGSYALSAAYKDGSADFYVFRGDPAHLKQMAARTGVITQSGTPALPNGRPMPPPQPSP